MKSISCALVLSLIPLALPAQEAAKPSSELSASQKAFLNLPEKDRAEFMKKLGEAQRFFQQKRLFEAIESATAASKIFKDSPDLHNLLGACQTEFRDFDKAMTHFKEADRLLPNQAAILFNVAELQFVTKQWADAEASFIRILTLLDPEKDAAQLQLARMSEFKLLLCKLKLGKKEEASKLAEKYDYLDDSPFPYYAQAAMHFDAGEDIQAEAAMARAARIFQDPAILSGWQDTMIEYGYIKSFFGGEGAGEGDE